VLAILSSHDDFDTAGHRGEPHWWPGVRLAVAVGFITGLISHFIQASARHGSSGATRPVWAVPASPQVLSRDLRDRVAGGRIPLLVVKSCGRCGPSCSRLRSLWDLGPDARASGRRSLVLVVSSLFFQLTTGLPNIAQCMMFKFFFTTRHYAMSLRGSRGVGAGAHRGRHPFR